MLPDKHVLHLIQNGQDRPTHWTQGRSTSGLTVSLGQWSPPEPPALLSGGLSKGWCGVRAFGRARARTAGVHTRNVTLVSAYGDVTGHLWVSVHGNSVTGGLHSWGLRVHERGRHLKCPPVGSSSPLPTSLAALQRLLVAQPQLHVEGVTVLPEGNPCRVRQALGTAATVAYSSRRRGPCKGAELRKWPRVLPGTAFVLPTLPPTQVGTHHCYRHT